MPKECRPDPCKDKDKAPKGSKVPDRCRPDPCKDKGEKGEKPEKRERAAAAQGDTPPPPSQTTSSSRTSSTTSTSVAAAPRVVRFAATAASPLGRCAKDEQQVQLAWSTTDATAATMTGPGAPDKVLEPSGSTTVCAPLATAGPVYVLTATGPGGTATAKDGA